MATNQHYVPRAYLEGFVDPASVQPGRDAYLWVVDFDERTVRKRAPKNVAAVTGYYDIHDTRYGGESVEKIYARIESEAIPLFKKLRGGNVQLAITERHALATYIGLQLSRVPAFYDAASRAEKKVLEQKLVQLVADERLLEEKLARYKATIDHASTLTVESVKSAIMGGKMKLQPSANASEHFTAVGVWVGFELAALVFSMRWTFFQNQTEYKFFASDNPVALLMPDATAPKELWDDSLQVAVPISANGMLLIHLDPEGVPFKTLTDPKEVDYIGVCILPTAHRFVFCSSSEQAHKLLNRRITQIEKKRPEL